MSQSPVISFGQQPCGIFPRRFLYAKFQTARALQKEIGGRMVFFYHDSDHDHRETQSLILTGSMKSPVKINFCYCSKMQRKYSPLYLKQISDDWLENTVRQLTGLIGHELSSMVASVDADNPADFCLEMYRKLGLLDGIEVIRSSDPEIRQQAIDVEDYFIDMFHEGETVRARLRNGSPMLFRGGSTWSNLPDLPYGKAQISPTRDTRLRWMQSVVGCTHYVCGAGEKAYLNESEAPEINFIMRDEISRDKEAWIPES